MTNLEPMYRALRQVGEDPEKMFTPQTAFIIAHGHDHVAAQAAAGVLVEARHSDAGVDARVTVQADCVIATPVHLCFGLFERVGTQNVTLTLTLEQNSRATFWSHCLFMTPEHARHAMTATVEIQGGATLVYQEAHYHGLSGGIEVIPHAQVAVGPRARYVADFTLVQGRVGKLDIDYLVNVAEDGVAELTSKVYGRGADAIRIREVVSLNGKNARGLIKSRVAVDDDATAEIIGATYGNAAFARGHVDCMEVVRGNAKASAIPEVRVTHPLAKVTHEAAIGAVDQKQLETLMARGLAPEEAVDRIILGMLGDV